MSTISDLLSDHNQSKAVKAYILARVSSKEQEDNFSLTAQIKNLESYCASKNLTIARSIQLVESSTKGERNEFNAIIKEILKSNELIAIVVDCVDRLQRSFKETVILGDLVKQGKIELHFRRENMIINRDSNSMQYLMWNFAVMMAEAYVLQLAENVKRGNKEKFSRGEWAGKAHFGYYNGPNAQNKPWIYVDESKREFINWLFEAYASNNWSMRMLAEESIKRGFMVASTKNRHKTSTVEQILKQPFYCGIMRRNGKEAFHAYESIITQSLFYKVQDVLVEKSKKKQKNNSIPYIFNHVFRCEKCNGAVVGTNPKAGFIYYRCSNAKCENYKSNKSEVQLLDQIENLFSKFKLTDEQIDMIVEELKKSVESKNKFQIDTINALTDEKKIILNRIDKMYLDKLDDGITQEMYDKLSKQMQLQIRDIDVELSKHTSGNENFYITAERVLKVCSKAPKLFKNASISERQNILKLISYNSTVDGSNYALNLREPFNLIFNFSSCPSWHGRKESNHRQRFWRPLFYH